MLGVWNRLPPRYLPAIKFANSRAQISRDEKWPSWLTCTFVQPNDSINQQYTNEFKCAFSPYFWQLSVFQTHSPYLIPHLSAQIYHLNKISKIFPMYFLFFSGRNGIYDNTFKNKLCQQDIYSFQREKFRKIAFYWPLQLKCKP